RLGRPGALRVSAVLHAIAFALIALIAITLWKAVPAGVPEPTWAVALMIFLVAVAGVLLYLEQRFSEDVNLAFFKVNVWVGFVVLAIVLLGRWLEQSSSIV